MPRLFYRWTQAHYTAGVVGVLRNDAGKILLVNHVYHPRNPWGLPGGWLERREEPATGLKRELREETGIEISIQAPLIINNGHMGQHLDIAFLCDAHNDVTHLSEELLDYQWIDAHEIPRLLPFHYAAVKKYLEIGQSYVRSEPSLS